MYEIDKSLLEKIDALELSERNVAWRKAMKEAPWRVYVDRERLTIASWHETEGEDLELRTAKMLKKVMDNVPIKIHPFDEIVGRPTTGVIGCQTAINVCGDYIHDIWNDDGVIGVTLDIADVGECEVVAGPRPVVVDIGSDAQGIPPTELMFGERPDVKLHGAVFVQVEVQRLVDGRLLPCGVLAVTVATAVAVIESDLSEDAERFL